MGKYEIEMVKKYYRYIEVEAPDKATALSLACDMVSEPGPEPESSGFVDYGNGYEAEVVRGPENNKGYII